MTSNTSNQDQEHTEVSPSSTGGFAAGFGVGTAVGTAFAYFLHSKEGKLLKEEFTNDVAKVKAKLFQENLIPTPDMRVLDIVVHMMQQAAEFLEVPVEETDTASSRMAQRKTKTPEKKIVARVTRTTKKRPKKFVGR